MATLGDLKTWAANNGLTWNEDTYTKAYNALNNVNTNNPKTSSSSTSNNITTDMSNAATAAKTNTATTVTGDVVTYDPVTGRILTTTKSNTTTPTTNTTSTSTKTSGDTTKSTSSGDKTKFTSTDSSSSDTVSNSGKLESSILTDKDDAFIKSTLQSIKDKGLFDTELQSGYDLNDIKNKLISMYNSNDSSVKAELNKIRADISNERLARGMGTSWKFLGTTGTSEKTTTSTGTTIDNSSGSPEYTGKTGDTWNWNKSNPGEYKTTNTGDYQTIGYLADGSIVYVRYGEYVPGVSSTKPTNEQILSYNNSIQDGELVTEWLNSGSDLSFSDYKVEKAKKASNTNGTTTSTTQTTNTNNATANTTQTTTSTNTGSTALKDAESKASSMLNKTVDFANTFKYAWNSEERMYIANLAGIIPKDYIGSSSQNTQIKNFLKTNYNLSI